MNTNLIHIPFKSLHPISNPFTMSALIAFIRFVNNNAPRYKSMIKEYFFASCLCDRPYSRFQCATPPQFGLKRQFIYYSSMIRPHVGLSIWFGVSLSNFTVAPKVTIFHGPWLDQRKSFVIHRGPQCFVVDKIQCHHNWLNHISLRALTWCGYLCGVSSRSAKH